MIITSTDQEERREELIPKWRSITVFEGESVEKGDVIVDGASDPHAILRLLGVGAFANYIINEVQDVYRLQGVTINDKHIEVITKQMLRKVVITDGGDSMYMKGDIVLHHQLQEEIDRIGQDGVKPKFERVLLGITKASLSTESWISAASFQETTRILTDSAFQGKRDELKGLKENVIVGRLIPAGTGFKKAKPQVSASMGIDQLFTTSLVEEESDYSDSHIGDEMSPDETVEGHSSQQSEQPEVTEQPEVSEQPVDGQLDQTKENEE